MGQKINEWEHKLAAQFKERLNIAMAITVREKYIIADVRNRQKSRKYAAVITQAAKSAELRSTEHIVILIYKRLDLEF